ncbi:MAG: hypothetical protein Q8K22_02145 [Rhodoferax sp.]|nr:hypothetical protein [Rhodoferax sp.]
MRVINKPLLQGQRALWAVALLMLALVLSQTLGLWHGIVHGPVTLAHTAHTAQATHTLHAAPAAHAGVSEPWLGTHGGQAGSADCRLYDQCSHVDALVQVPALALPLVLTSFVLLVLAGLARARWHAHFQARGPPLVR